MTKQQLPIHYIFYQILWQQNNQSTYHLNINWTQESVVEWHRCIVDIGELRLCKVIFDHCTGTRQHDRQRGYCNCAVGHDNCFRWRECHLFADRSRFAAYMYAWATTPTDGDRTQHMSPDFEPSHDLVEQVFQSMTLTDF